MSIRLTKAAVLLACLGLFAGCGGDEKTPPPDQGTGGTGGTGGSGGSGGTVDVGLCGNGIEEGNEECDDGDLDDDDGCLSNCKIARCGDGVRRTDGTAGEVEACDDGDKNSDTDPDACRTDCTLPRCGDGVVDPSLDESCDLGAANSDAADATCRTNCQPARCGDGVTDPSRDELCDDGNDSNDDACRNDCTPSVCGDGVVDGNEECDDGNDIDTDSCTSDCAFNHCGDGFEWAGVEECDDPDQTKYHGDCNPATCLMNKCGDGYEHPDPLKEACEPGVTDGCRSDCTMPACPDGVADYPGGEECDDGNMDTGDSCMPNCKWARCGDGHVHVGAEECDPLDSSPGAPTNCRLPGHPAQCTIPRCGDGFTDPGEQCDDANDVETDGCLSTCQLATCGDGIVRSTGPSPEQCDLGANNSDTAPNTCRTNCKLPSCGDNVVDRGETCDDGNRSNTDGCTNTCVPNICGDGFRDPAREGCDNGTANSDTAANACRRNCQPASCGDGVRDTGEACDSGANNSNTNPDACRLDCTLARCGDGVTDTARGEQCDAGAANGNTPNGCRASCRLPSCGDGVIDTASPFNEVCDDGNTVDTDECRATCQPARCGDGVVRTTGPNPEACDDGNGLNNDNCLNSCQFATGGFTFTGFGTLEATMRGEVSVATTLGATFDPAARLRWKLTVQNASNAPVAGVRFFFPPAGNSGDHTTWTDSDVTSTEGTIFFGPTAGSTAADLGLFAGTPLRLSAVFANAGAYTVRAELVNVAGNGVVGSGSTAATVGAKKLTVTYSGFDSIPEAVRTRVSMTARLDASIAPARLVRWRITVSQGGAPIQGIRAFYDDGSTGSTDHRDWTAFIETDGQGEMFFGPTGGFAASQLQVSGGLLTPFSLLVPLAGDYDVKAELIDAGTSALVGFQSTTAHVTFDALVTTFDGFDVLGSNIRAPARVTARLDSRFQAGTIAGKWRISVTDGSGNPVSGARFYFPTGSDGPDHSTWTNAVETLANGQAIFDSGRALTQFQTPTGRVYDFSVQMPSAGARTIRFDLLNAATDALIDGDATSVTVGEGVTMTFSGYGALVANARGRTNHTAVLHSSFDPNEPLLWKLTVTNGTTGESGVTFFYPTGSDGQNHTTWNTSVTTGTDGSTLWPASGPFVAADTLLQDLGGDFYQFSVVFPNAGSYTLRADLVLASSPATVVGGGSTQVTVR